MQSRNARSNVLLDGMVDIDGVAVAGVSVRKDRHVAACGEPPPRFDHFAQADEAHIRKAIEIGGYLRASHEESLIAQGFGHSCVKRAETAGHDEKLRTPQEFPKTGSGFYCHSGRSLSQRQGRWER